MQYYRDEKKEAVHVNPLFWEIQHFWYENIFLYACYTKNLVYKEHNLFFISLKSKNVGQVWKLMDWFNHL